ncbi:hypothetical protein [Chitinophaga agri]|nr:hypothetical protein [Chitinophaga agri]
MQALIKLLIRVFRSVIKVILNNHPSTVIKKRKKKRKMKYSG